MGVLLGSRNDFLSEIGSPWIPQLPVFHLIPSVLFRAGSLSSDKDIPGKEAAEEKGGSVMVYLAVIALAGGIACGMAGLDQSFPVKLITANKDLIHVHTDVSGGGSVSG